MNKLVKIYFYGDFENSKRIEEVRVSKSMAEYYCINNGRTYQCAKTKEEALSRVIEDCRNKINKLREVETEADNQIISTRGSKIERLNV